MILELYKVETYWGPLKEPIEAIEMRIPQMFSNPHMASLRSTVICNVVFYFCELLQKKV